MAAVISAGTQGASTIKVGDKVPVTLINKETGISKTYEGTVYEDIGHDDYLAEVTLDNRSPFTVMQPSASTTTTHPWDESHTAEELVASLTLATYETSSDALLLLRNPNGLIEEWQADPADIKKYRDLRNDDGDFTFEPLEKQVTVLKGRIAEGYVPIGISAPGSKYNPAGRHAVGFGLTKEVAGLILRAYDEGFRRAQDLHGESMDFVIDAVKELFGDASCSAFLNAYYKGKNVLPVE
jgi:hypothetical protein